MPDTAAVATITHRLGDSETDGQTLRLCQRRMRDIVRGEGKDHRRLTGSFNGMVSLLHTRSQVK